MPRCRSTVPALGKGGAQTVPGCNALLVRVNRPVISVLMVLSVGRLIPSKVLIVVLTPVRWAFVVTSLLGLTLLEQILKTVSRRLISLLGDGQARRVIIVV